MSTSIGDRWVNIVQRAATTMQIDVLLSADSGALMSKVHAVRTAAAAPVVHARAPIAFAATVDRGRPLPVPLRAKMERALGHDFSRVRIHENDRARRLGANAFARGSHVYFAPGKYRPASREGQALLGEELAHLGQQAEGRVDATRFEGSVGVNDDHGLEREAKRAGRRAAHEHMPQGRPALAPTATAFSPERAASAAATAASPQVTQLNGDGKKKTGFWSGLFQRHIYGPHSYNVTHQVADVNTPEREQEVIDDVQHRPTSGWRSQDPVTPQGNFRVAVPVGVVKSKALPTGVQNETTPFHLLHSAPLLPGFTPGIVKRQVVSDGSGLHINTQGTGTGLFPSLNEGLAQNFWGIPAHLTRMKTDPEYRVKVNTQRMKDLDEMFTGMARDGWK
jgi:hypothetical protein